MYLQKKFYYLYKITNLINYKIYVGVHSTNDLDDGYMGSGKGIKYAIKKYGIENFKKEILEYFNDADAMFGKEAIVVNESFVSDPNTYNNVVGGNKPPVGRKLGSTMPAEAKEKIRRANLGKTYSAETNSKKGAKKENHWTYNIPRSNEVKEKLRYANLGKTYSAETNKKKSDATKGIPKTEQHKANMRKPKPLIVCPHCGKEGGAPQMKQWHFNNCKIVRKLNEI
jgi:hypothetical protein